MGALATVPTAFLQRSLEFKKLFYANIASPVTSSIVSVVLAMNGFGYWSLVIGPVLGITSTTVAVWMLTSWRPRFSLNLGSAMSLVTFGSWVVAAGLIAWCFGQVDNAICGYRLGTSVLGVYA